MVNRVLVDYNGLKVSKPGIDVLYASDNDLLFTSKGIAYRPYASGQTYIPGRGTFAIPIGKSFAGSPLMIAWAGDYVFAGVDIWSCFMDIDGNGTSTEASLGWRRGDNNMVFYISGNYQQPFPEPPFVLNWIVFDWDSA